MTESINDEAVYRTAPATPGLLIIIDVCVKAKVKIMLRHFQKKLLKK